MNIELFYVKLTATVGQTVRDGKEQKEGYT